MADDPTTDDTDAPEDAQPEPQPAPQRPTAAKDDGDDLAEAGRRALDAERKARREADKQLKAATAELEKLRQQTMTDTERAIAEAKAQGRQEALIEATGRLVRAEVRAAAGGKLADPDDAAMLLGDLSEFVSSNGDVDSKAISKAIDELVKQKPYLAPQGTKPAPLPGGGATPSNGFDMDGWIRQSAGRR